MDTGMPLNAKRPWITDPDDLPENNPLHETLLNPIGRSSKLPFTRAWTWMFFANLLLVPATIAMLFSAPAIGLVLLIIHVLITLMSFVSHVRRLNDSPSSSLWAVLVLAPLIIGGAMFTMKAQSAVKVANGITAMQQLGGAAQKIQKNNEKPRASSNGRANGRSRGGRRGRRGGRGGGGNGGGPPGDIEPMSIVMFMSLPIAAGLWALISLGVMLWSLLWVARRPRREQEA